MTGSKYETLFKEKGDSAHYWLPSYLALSESAWLVEQGLSSSDTNPLVPASSEVHSTVTDGGRDTSEEEDPCARPSCGDLDSVLRQPQGTGGVFGVGWGRAARSATCAAGPFDTEGFAELVEDLGGWAAGGDAAGGGAQ